jgi:hypothetical protein
MGPVAVLEIYFAFGLLLMIAGFLLRSGGDH